MPLFSSPAIVLHRADYGDFDLILTLFSLEEGKIKVIAKSAKKSAKRFPGVLELFCTIDAVCRRSRSRGGMPALQEASLVKAHPAIRTDFKKTAYAGYWAEIASEWSEEGVGQPSLFALLERMLEALDGSEMPDEVLSLLYQIRFLKLAGLHPNLTQCRTCRVPVSRMQGLQHGFDLAKGALVCDKCESSGHRLILLSKGLLKQLQWMSEADLETACRIRLSPDAQRQARDFLEAFIPHHLGRPFRSLKVLRQLRA